jgi:hypothetical protein
VVDPGHLQPCRSQRYREPAGADAELEDGTAGPTGESEVQVEVPWVVDQVEVVQPSEGRRLG